MIDGYEVNERAILGWDAGDHKDIVVLAWTVRCAKEEFWSVPGSNGVVPPAVRVEAEEGELEDDLGRAEASRYRAAAARASYLGVDLDHPIRCKRQRVSSWRRQTPRAQGG